MTDCSSAFTAWTGLTLRCTGKHLRGNIFRGTVHQAWWPAGGVTWTWYDDEADRTDEIADVLAPVVERIARDAAGRAREAAAAVREVADAIDDHDWHGQMYGDHPVTKLRAAARLLDGDA